MKNLENSGVIAMSASEMKTVSGGLVVIAQVWATIAPFFSKKTGTENKKMVCDFFHTHENTHIV